MSDLYPKSEVDISIKNAIETNAKLYIWILGGPASGKGTQSQLLSERYQFSHLSTGDILRQTVDGQSDATLAQKIRETWQRGGLIDTSTTLQMLEQFMKESYNNFKGYIVDGYPREVRQGLDFCQKFGTPHKILYLQCPDHILRERLLQRGRIDDNEYTIRLRLSASHSVSKVLISQWQDRIDIIDGNRSVETVGRECASIIQKLIGDLKLNDNTLTTRNNPGPSSKF